MKEEGGGGWSGGGGWGRLEMGILWVWGSL